MELINREKEYDATLLINCLLGLLVLPKEKYYEKFIPEIPFERLQEWGISDNSLKKCECEFKQKHKPTLKQLVRLLRNSVAHFDITPQNENGEVKCFTFKNRKNFEMELSVGELRLFIAEFSKLMIKNIEPN